MLLLFHLKLKENKMGRPLQKKFFGNPDGTGKQLVLSYVWLAGSTEAEEGFYVIRQVGTGRYQVTNGDKVGVVKLTDALPTMAGEGVIIIKPYGAAQVEYARKIQNRSVTTFDGNTYKWSSAAATEEGQADLPFEVFITEEDKAADLEDLLGAANSAAIVTLLNTAPEAFMDSTVAQVYAGLETNGGGRKSAVGDGFAQFVEIFGEPTTLAQAQEIIARHVAIEAKKGALIRSVDSATSAVDLLEALKVNVPIVSEDRDALIRELSASDVDAAKELAETLADDDYTIVFGMLAADIKSGKDLTDLGVAVFANRQAQTGKKFNGVTKMIAAIKTAFAA
jgi:hypothetical protein